MNQDTVEQESQPGNERATSHDGLAALAVVVLAAALIALLVSQII